MRSVTLGFLVLIALSRTAHASEESSFETLQPIWTFGGLVLSHVTMTTYDEAGEPAVASVRATCDSNQVMTPYGPKQRNAAFTLGFRAEVISDPTKDSPLFGDTLRVVLHVTEAPRDLDDISFDTVLGATMDCILFNAAHSSAIRFVALRIDGPTAYRKYGGVYPAARYRNGPRQREYPPKF